MKEATSELNAGVVVLLAIGVLIAFFYYTIWPEIKQNFASTSQCSKAICETCDGYDCKTVTCHLKENPKKTFECVYKG